MSDGRSAAATTKGVARVGPIDRGSLLRGRYWMRLSPPMPTVWARTALTIVSWPATTAPTGAAIGRPLAIMTTSVVVPPISATTPSSSPLSVAAPSALAAGPDKIVSIGRLRTNSEDTNDPSPRITIRRPVTPDANIDSSTAVTNSLIIGTRRALSRAVVARLGAFKFEDNS